MLDEMYRMHHEEEPANESQRDESEDEAKIEHEKVKKQG